MEKSFFSYRSDLCVEENVWAELYRRNLLAERYRVVHMQIFAAIEFSTVYMKTLERALSCQRGVSKLFKVRFYYTEVRT